MMSHVRNDLSDAGNQKITAKSLPASSTNEPSPGACQALHMRPDSPNPIVIRPIYHIAGFNCFTTTINTPRKLLGWQITEHPNSTNILIRYCLDYKLSLRRAQRYSWKPYARSQIQPTASAGSSRARQASCRFRPPCVLTYQ